MPLAEILARAHEIHQVDTSIVESVSGDVDTVEGRALVAACNEYSILRPRRRVAVITSTDAYLYILPTIITGWGPNHFVEKVQFPYLNTAEEIFVDDNMWRQTIDPATESPCLRFVSGMGRPTADWALWYLEPHTVNTATLACTIPVQDEEALAQLTASLVLDIAANYTCRFFETSTLTGDSIDYRSLANRYQTQSQAARARFDDLVGKKLPVFSPSFADLDIESPLGPRTMHPSWLY